MAVFTQRSKVNLISFAVTIVVMLVAVKLSDGSFATHINKITKNLDKSLMEIMKSDEPIYTPITKNVTYDSNVIYDAKGMQGLYNLTNKFLEAVLPLGKIQIDDFVIIEDNGALDISPTLDNWQHLLKTYIGVLMIMIVILLFVLFMPICGFCFCCCRCCGKCGSRSQPYDKRNDFCKKFIFASLLIVLGTLLLFAVVCAFASNEQLNEGVNDLTDNLEVGLKDTDKYIEATIAEIDVLLNTNYNKFNKKLTSTIDNSASELYTQLLNYSHAVSMTEMVRMMNITAGIQTKFEFLKSSSIELRNYASQLSDAVRQLKKNLLETLKDDQTCKGECAKLRDEISKLQTNIHFNSIPDISTEIETIQKINSDEIRNAIATGAGELENIKSLIEGKINSTLANATLKINQAGTEIKQKTAEINQTIVTFKDELIETGNKGVNKANKFIRDYSKYSHYVGLAISCVLLLISLCIVLGLICGICGKRPDVYGDDCCNKGAGSQFLICGVMLMFISGFLIAILVFGSFLLGTLSQRLVCDPLQDPQHSNIMPTIEKLIKNYVPVIEERNVNISYVLDTCNQNGVIYDAFKLQSLYDVNDIQNYMDKFDIEKILNELDISGINLNIELLDQDTIKLLNETAQNQEIDNIDFDKFSELAKETNLTTTNLDDLVKLIDNVINQIVNKRDFTNLISTLELSKLQLQTYQTKIVNPMIELINQIVDKVASLKEDIKFGKNSFKDAITQVLDEIQNAQERLNSDEMKNQLTTIAKSFAGGLKELVQSYLDLVTNSVTQDVGKCKPLHNVFTATVTSSCDNIILRWNGFWFSLLWSLFLFIPLIVISVLLATLYQKFNPYNGSLIEAEYLYDAYAERDNIPLNSRNSKIKKKKHKRHQDDRPIPSGGGDMLARDYAGASHHQDARYSDMAPKQWEDFPANGPPQYQRAPTEYERPPPYYYPDTNESNQ